MSEPIVMLRRISHLRERVAAWRQGGATVGLVPTMGALHEGHLTLVRRARCECQRTVVTLFVNPKQFGRGEDLATYPRDEAGDRDKLAMLGVDALFAPEVAEMYPEAFATTVTVAGLTEHLCGRHRPMFFAGVATVVTKLLLQSLPDAAYFGEKDYQQLQVVRRLARDLDMPVRVVGVPTVRDADGLALSSRNQYLSSTERAVAVALPRTLQHIARHVADVPETVTSEVSWGREELLRAGFSKVDYDDVCEEETLQPVTAVTKPARVFAAAWLGRTRLIDNMPVQR